VTHFVTVPLKRTFTIVPPTPRRSAFRKSSHRPGAFPKLVVGRTGPPVPLTSPPCRTIVIILAAPSSSKVVSKTAVSRRSTAPVHFITSIHANTLGRRNRSNLKIRRRTSSMKERTLSRSLNESGPTLLQGVAAGILLQRAAVVRIERLRRRSDSRRYRGRG